MSYPDVEVSLMGYLADLAYCVTWTPLELKAVLPVLRIQRIGGSSDKVQFHDYPNVMIQAFTTRTAADPRAAHDLTALVRARMDAIAGIPVTGGLLDSSEMVSGPIEQVWPDAAVSVVQTIYRVTTRGT